MAGPCEGAGSEKQHIRGRQTWTMLNRAKTDEYEANRAHPSVAVIRLPALPALHLTAHPPRHPQDEHKRPSGDWASQHA